MGGSEDLSVKIEKKMWLVNVNRHGLKTLWKRIKHFPRPLKMMKQFPNKFCLETVIQSH